MVVGHAVEGAAVASCLFMCPGLSFIFGLWLLELYVLYMYVTYICPRFHLYLSIVTKHQLHSIVYTKRE